MAVEGRKYGRFVSQSSFSFRFTLGGRKSVCFEALPFFGFHRPRSFFRDGCLRRSIIAVFNVLLAYSLEVMAKVPLTVT